MAFLIRTIDTTASGRAITRDRALDQTTLTIGRATDNDIHLPDLAVEQHHARITTAADTNLSVDAVGTLGFTYDGRKVTSASFDPAKGAELGFGSYRLQCVRDNDGAALITITQVTDAAHANDAVNRFTLAATLPSKRIMAWTGLAAILCAFLAIPIYSHLTREQVAPDYDTPGAVRLDASWCTGALSKGHHGLEDKCEACHVDAFVSVRDETCLTCHEAIGDHAEIPRQLTGRGPMSWGDQWQWRVAEMFGKEGPGSCTTCHARYSRTCLSTHKASSKLAHESQVFNNVIDGLRTRELAFNTHHWNEKSLHVFSMALSHNSLTTHHFVERRLSCCNRLKHGPLEDGWTKPTRFACLCEGVIHNGRTKTVHGICSVFLGQ